MIDLNRLLKELVEVLSVYNSDSEGCYFLCSKLNLFVVESNVVSTGKYWEIVNEMKNARSGKFDEIVN